MSRRDVLIEALEATPRDLTRMAKRLSATEALSRPTEHAWCIADIVAHLADIEVRYMIRLRQIITEDRPTVPSIDPDPAAHDLSRPLTDLCDTFSARRAETIAFLRSLEQRDWARPLIHTTAGPSRFRDQIQALIDHDSDHLAQIVALRD